MWVKAWAAAPLSAISVPIPIPVTMKPTWFTMEYARMRRMSFSRRA